MIEKIKRLIERSLSLPEDKKGEYLAVLPFISEENQKDLLNILEKEQKELLVIEDEMAEEESEINKEYLKEIESLYKEEYKNAVSSVEKGDKDRAENLINNFDK